MTYASDGGGPWKKKYPEAAQRMHLDGRQESSVNLGGSRVEEHGEVSVHHCRAEIENAKRKLCGGESDQSRQHRPCTSEKEDQRYGDQELRLENETAEGEAGSHRAIRTKRENDAVKKRSDRAESCPRTKKWKRGG